MNSVQTNMDALKPTFPESSSSTIFSNNNIIIIVLVVLLIFSFLGINIWLHNWNSFEQNCRRSI